MSWTAIWAVIKGLLGKLNKDNRWKMSIDGKREGDNIDVQIDDKGIRFEFEVKGKAVKLEALPGDLKHAVVKVNGEVDEDARLVFSLRYQPLKPLICVFEFKRVTINGETKRYRFDNPK